MVKAAGLALLLLGLGLLLGLTEQLLRRQFKGRLTKIWLIFYVWLREKAFSMDRRIDMQKINYPGASTQVL